MNLLLPILIGGFFAALLGNSYQPRPDVIKVYRVGSHVFKIRFKFNTSQGFWELWVLAAPKNTRGGSVHVHHLYPNNKVCITTGKEPKGDQLDKARAIAQAWVNGYSNYINTGTFGKNGGVKVNVPD